MQKDAQALGPAEMASPSSALVSPFLGTKRAAGIEIWLGHCQTSQLYPEIPACPRDVLRERAGSVVPRLSADTGVGRGFPLGPVWDFYYWLSEPEHWRGTGGAGFGISSQS